MKAVLARLCRVERRRAAVRRALALIIIARNAEDRARQLADLPSAVFDGRTLILTITGISS